MTLVWRPGFQFDADASTYIEAVEAADTQALETDVRYAINDFVIGCKQDGIWDAIKASCILAGARTLAGALVPLVGTAPTNNGPFVSADYNRETGLVGDGSTKWLNSNRANNADPQNNCHCAVYSTLAEASNLRRYFGSEIGGVYGRLCYTVTANNSIYVHANGGSMNAGSITSIGLIGVSRSSSSLLNSRCGGVTLSSSVASTNHQTPTIGIFAGHNGSAPVAPCDARLAFYSIGESLNLAALDTRVSALITAIGAAIP
jgi:hypothetical protein